jgi:hypothetical protein
MMANWSLLLIRAWYLKGNNSFETRELRTEELVLGDKEDMTTTNTTGCIWLGILNSNMSENYEANLL